MTSNFELRCSHDGDSVVLWAEGEFDLAGRHFVLEAAVPALMKGQTVVLDLHNVTFIDAGGLGTLVACAQAAVNSGARFTFRRAQGRVAHLLKMTGVAEFISDEPDPAPLPSLAPNDTPEPGDPADPAAMHVHSTGRDAAATRNPFSRNRPAGCRSSRRRPTAT